MNSNDNTTVVHQENGPIGSTAENVPPIQEKTKDDNTGDIKDMVDSNTSSTDVAAETTTNNLEKNDKSENVNDNINNSKDDSTTKIEDISNEDDKHSCREINEIESDKHISEDDKESIKINSEDIISTSGELKRDSPTNSNFEETQSVEKVVDCNEKKEDTVVEEKSLGDCEKDSKIETPKAVEEKSMDETVSISHNGSNLNSEDTNKDAEVTPKSRPRRSTAVNDDNSKETKEEPTTGKRGRRSKIVRTTNNVDGGSSAIEKTPSTEKRGRKATKIQDKISEDKVVEEENVDVEPMDVDEDIEIKTPKRGKKVSQKSTPVISDKKRGVKRKNNDELPKDNKKVKSDEDAYNIDNLDEHPEIGDSFKVERQSNGGAKFLATSSHKKGRFSEIEKAAKERNADSFKEDSEDKLETPEKKSISLLTLSDKKLVSQIDDEKNVEKKGHKTPISKSSIKTPKSILKTPKIPLKNSVKKSSKVTPTSVKNLDIGDFTLPDMTEDSQFEADTKFEFGDVNQYARVYAFYSGVCYAAVTTGKSTVSSFEVQFMDDKVVKYIARGGIYRLQELVTGLEVEFMDGENIFEGTIKSIPDSTRASDFYKANFTIEKKDDDGKTSDVVVSWDKIILDKSILKNVRNVEAEIKTIGKTPKRKNQL